MREPVGTVPGTGWRRRACGVVAGGHRDARALLEGEIVGLAGRQGDALLRCEVITIAGSADQVLEQGVPCDFARQVAKGGGPIEYGGCRAPALEGYRLEEYRVFHVLIAASSAGRRNAEDVAGMGGIDRRLDALTVGRVGV